MKQVCCDTSFLFALYGNDVHTGRAVAYVRKLRQPLVLSIFNEFELENAFRFAGWRQLLPAVQVNASLAAFDADRRAGRLAVSPCNLAEVVAEARRLSAKHTAVAGHRSFDILHVAAGLVLKAGEFLSFDANQRRLAEAEGLKVNR